MKIPATKGAMPYTDWTRIISASVAPVVIISACGLLCLAFYNRLAAIVSRLREFQRERLAEQEDIAPGEPETATETDRRRKRLEHLKIQTRHVTRRAKLIQRTLFFLLLTIALLIGCCVMLAVSIVAPSEVFLAVVLFILGLLSMLAGTIAAMFELKSALEPAELESQFVSEILREGNSRPRDSV